MAKIDFSEVVKREEEEREVKAVLDRPAYVSVAQVKHLRGEKELTLKEIGLILGVTKQAIHYICQTRNITKGGIKKYKGVRESNWLHTEEQLLDMTPDQIKEITPGDRITKAAIAVDKVQILSGQPTQVVGYVDLMEVYNQILAEEAKLGKDAIDVTPEEDDEADVSNTP